MPSFCLPCWPGAASSHFDDDKLVGSPTKTEANSAPDNDDLQKPTAGEYAGVAGREFLTALGSVAGAIPVPGLALAVQLATNLIAVCDESSATLGKAEELKARIKLLVTVLVDDLKDKKAEEIQEKLKKDVEMLRQDLEYIQKKLNEIAYQHAFLLVFFRGMNAGKVQQCMTRLSNSMERFNLSRNIDQTNVLDQLEKNIINFHSSLQQSLKTLQVGMDQVLASLDKSSQSRPRSSIPANTQIFHGRNAVVAEFVGILTQFSEGQKRPRACLLGPGGVGKTSTALAVMAHPELKKCFPEKNQVWIPCVKATSISLFLDTLYTSLAITQNSGNTRDDILAELRASTEPLILLLDNFETPWNADGGRSETERLLRDIEQIPHVALFITMRSSGPPCDGIRWHSVDIRAVDADAARQIYSDIYPAGSTDPNLSKLLDAIGHMPLAVKMMAKVAKNTGLSAEELIEEYKQLGTALLGQGSDAEHSMDLCISLSVDSSPMKKNPEALQLLAIITLLPVGTTFKMLKGLWARSLQNLVGALEVLNETSLIERRGSGTYFALPVIRRYILDPSRFPDNVRTSMIDLACDFLALHKSSPGDTSYKEHTAALSAEEGNLEAILLETTADSSKLNDALLVLATHQQSTRPRTDVIEHALKLANAMEDNATLLGPALFCYGGILFSLGRYDDAIKQSTLARKIFLSTSQKALAAECLLQIASVHRRLRHEPSRAGKALRVIEEAKSEFDSVNDKRGAALCLYHLGVLHSYEPNKSPVQALDFLTRANEMFTDLQDALALAYCSHKLGALHLGTGKYDDAQVAYTSAIQGYERIGYYETGVLRGLSRAFVMMGDYNGALKLLMQSLEESKSHGNPFDIARTLKDMGRCWTKMGNKVNAQKAFEKSQRYASSIMYNPGVMLCNFFLKRLEDPLLIPSMEESQYWFTSYEEDVQDIMKLLESEQPEADGIAG